MALILLSCFALALRLGLIGNKPVETTVIGTKALPIELKEEITYIEITSSKDVVRLQKITGQELWEMVDPIGAPADNLAIDKLLDAVLHLSFSHTIKKRDKNNSESDNSDYLVQFGLDNPALTLLARTKNGEHTVTFGQKHPVSNRRYAKIDTQEQVIMIEESKFSLVDLKAFDLMDKTPTKFNPNNVQEILVESIVEPPIPRRKFVKEDDGFWHLYSSGDDIIIDPDVIENNLKKLSSIYVKNILLLPDKALSVYDLSPSRYTFSIKLNDSVKDFLQDPQQNSEGLRNNENKDQTRLMTLLFGEVAQTQDDSTTTQTNNTTDTVRKFYFKNASFEWVGKIETPVHYGFLKNAGEYRTKNIFFGISSTSISSIEIISLEEASRSKSTVKPIVINRTRKTDPWALLDGKVCDSSYETDSNKVSKWAQKLLDFKVLSYPDGIEAPKNSDYLWRIVLKNEMQDPVAILDIGQPVQSSKNNSSHNGTEAPRLGRFVGVGRKPVIFVVALDVVNELLEPMLCR